MTDDRKVLILTPQLPYPAHQGTALRNYYNMRGLAQRNQLDLLSYQEIDRAASIPEELSRLAGMVRTVPAPQRSTGRRIWQLATTRKPDMALRLHSGEYAEKLLQLLAQYRYDIVQVEGIEMAWTMPLIRRAAPAAAIVYDAHNAETVLQHRAGQADRGTIQRLPAVLYSQVQHSRLARYESRVCQSADAVTAVSEADRQALLALSGLAEDEITLIPNSIDVYEYAHDSGSRAELQKYDIVFSGKMDYRPNVDAVLWFANHVWPLIRRQMPGATWAVVGQKPHTRLHRLRTLEGVTVTGWVPDVRPYLHGAGVFIMPFRVGSGTRLKLIEAMAAGKAVVSTRVGAEGFPVEGGKHLLLADSAAQFAAASVDLLRDAALRDKLGRQGNLLAQQYDWRVVVPKFEDVYGQLTKAESRRSRTARSETKKPPD